MSTIYTVVAAYDSTVGVSTTVTKLLRDFQLPATIAYGYGYHPEWGSEPTVTLTIVDVYSTATSRPVFTANVRGFAESLRLALGQEAVLVYQYHGDAWLQYAPPEVEPTGEYFVAPDRDPGPCRWDDHDRFNDDYPF